MSESGEDPIIESLFYRRSAVLPERVWEVPGTRNETYDPYNFSASVQYICLWNERYARIESIRNLTYDATHKYFEYYMPAVCTKISVTSYAENFDQSPLKEV
ncbi:MAG: hypothetical protein LBJ67_03985, partial [Planctomycetaceae bacterium]|nr:hypothetical protein [Planctomycetaceae bacterium]